jgi:hypothetical protein
MTKALIISAMALAVFAFSAGAATADPIATVTFQLNMCELTITSTKDISNVGVNGVTTEDYADGTKTLAIAVTEGDVIAVKSALTTARFTVTGCLDDNGDGYD